MSNATIIIDVQTHGSTVHNRAHAIDFIEFGLYGKRRCDVIIDIVGD